MLKYETLLLSTVLFSDMKVKSFESPLLEITDSELASQKKGMPEVLLVV